MSPPAGFRLVTDADREAHPLVPPEALWSDDDGWYPTFRGGESWRNTLIDYAVPLVLWPEGDPAPEPESGIVKAAKSMDWEGG